MAIKDYRWMNHPLSQTLNRVSRLLVTSLAVVIISMDFLKPSTLYVTLL